MEHAGWVLFEDSVLITACIQKQREMRELAAQWAHLSVTKDVVDLEVKWRTAELEQGEQRMRESHLRTRKIIDTAYDAFVVVQLDGTIKRMERPGDRLDSAGQSQRLSVGTSEN